MVCFNCKFCGGDHHEMDCMATYPPRAVVPWRRRFSEAAGRGSARAAGFVAVILCCLIPCYVVVEVVKLAVWLGRFTWP